jgi:hypothetical protein
VPRDRGRPPRRGRRRHRRRSGVAQSKSSKAKSAATTLPEPLTHDSIRELVSRLSDEDVRKLLIDQLDRSAVPAKAKGDRAMSGMVEQNAGMVRERLARVQGCVLRACRRRCATHRQAGRARRTFGVMLVAALMPERCVAAGWRAALPFRAPALPQRLAPPPRRPSRRAFRLAVGLALDLVGIVVFALAFLALFLALWQGHGLRRIAILEMLIAVVAVRVTWLLAQFLLGGRREGAPVCRLPTCRRGGCAVRRLVAALWGRRQLRAVRAAGAMRASRRSTSADVHVAARSRIVLWTVWQVRAPIAALIRGDGTHKPVLAGSPICGR